MRICAACKLDNVEFRHGRSRRCIQCEDSGRKRTCKTCLNAPVYRDYSICKECLNIAEKRRRHEDQEYRAKKQANDKKHYATYKNKMREASNRYARTDKGKFKVAIRIARRRHLSWNLDLTTYISIANKPCYYCNNILSKPTEVGVGLDRIDNNKGYEISNVLSCCPVCNKIRGEFLTVNEAKAAISTVLSMRGYILDMTKKYTYEEALEALGKISDSSGQHHEEWSAIITALTEKHKNDEVNDNWDDLFDLINNMKEHAQANGQAIEIADIPHQLRWGWKCKNTGKTWSIKISNIKKCIDKLEDTEPTKADILRRCAQTQEGKNNLLDMINGK